MAQTQVGIPTNLLVYKPKQQYTALCWQINVASYVALDKLSFEVQVDVVDTFNSINLQVYTADNVEEFQNGTFFKSFVIKDPTLINDSQTYYWRVRVVGEEYYSQWSDVAQQNITEYLTNLTYNEPIQVLVAEDKYATITKTYAGNYVFVSETEEKQYDLTLEDITTILADDYDIEDTFYVYVGANPFTVEQVTWYTDTETAENLLPDNYVYTKIGATNIKKILEMYMRLIGVFKNEAIQVSNNINYEKVQDEDLYNRLGVLLSYTRNTLEPMITYKYELLSLWQAYLHQGTVDAFNIFIKALYGTEPEIEILKDIRETWRVYENVPLLSLDGSTSTITEFSIGESFYDPTLNRIITAQADNDWANALIELPDETATYQVYDQDNVEYINYHYDGISETLLEGRPDLDRYYLRERYYDEEINQETFTEKQGKIAYLYTKPYLAHNLVINITNPFGVDVDQTTLLAILNYLKPINMNIVINIKQYYTYHWGELFHYGQRGLYWGGYDPNMIDNGQQPSPEPEPVDTDCTIEIVNKQDAIVIINGEQRTQYRTQYGQEVSWSVSKAGYKTQSGTLQLKQAVALIIQLQPSPVGMYELTINPIPENAKVIINGIIANQLVLPANTEYTWKVELAGYITQNGTGTLTEDTTLEIDLNNPPSILDCEITAKVYDVDAGNINITDSSTIEWTIDGETTTGDTVTAQTGQTVQWTVSKDGYITQTGTYDVPELTTEKTIEISLYRQEYTLTIVPTPESATVVINGQERRTITLKLGRDYTYEISATGYIQETGSGTLTEDTTITTTMQRTSVSYTNLRATISNNKPTTYGINYVATYNIKKTGTYKVSLGGSKGHILVGNETLNPATKGGTAVLQTTFTSGDTITIYRIDGGYWQTMCYGGSGIGIKVNDVWTLVVGGGGRGYETNNSYRMSGGGGYIGGGSTGLPAQTVGGISYNGSAGSGTGNTNGSGETNNVGNVLSPTYVYGGTGYVISSLSSYATMTTGNNSSEGYAIIEYIG